MSQPQLFVGECEKLVDRAAAALWYLHVEAARKVHRADLLLPHEVQPVIAPAAGDLDHQLLLAGPVVRPIIGDDDLFHEIDRVARKWSGFGERNRGHRTLLERVDGAVPMSVPDTSLYVLKPKLTTYNDRRKPIFGLTRRISARTMTSLG